MANGASRIFKVMQNSGTDTVSELVHLKVKTINPLTFTLDDRVTLTEDFVELNSNIDKTKLKVNDILTAFSLNGGQLFFIQQYFSEQPLQPKLPAGGTKNQILSKKSNNDYDTEWIDNIEIINDLNSDSTTDALSAKQGKELNEKIKDTGWQTLTLTSDFKAYGDDSSNAPKYRKTGKLVEIAGQIAPTSNITAGTSVTIATLPIGFRPSTSRYFVCQGSGRAIWTLNIHSNGNINFSRYGTSAYANASTSVWLPFNVMFLID